MYAVSFYDSDPDADPKIFERIIEAYPRHRAYLDEFAKSGDVVMIGTFGNPATEGSMAVFRSREAAERFRENDPFYTEGHVWRSRILDWNPLEFGQDGTLLGG
ncbi:YciI family protein [Diaminobutyricibacter sp. McL0608]|uniref:YciI family protein n=1 Tax=Leifsonia sp. McL0608 TaxID=3143537 RepID=UPI0031F317BC